MTSSRDQIRLPTAPGPSGTTMLLVCCDIPGMFAAHPENAFIEFDGRVVLEIAEKKGFGVVVQNMVDGKESWAGVLKEDVADILAGKYGSG